MKNNILTRAVLAGVAIVALAIPVLAAGNANASTSGCTGGVYAGYCSTQTDGEAAPLSFDVYQQKAAVGNKIIGYVNADTDKATDFFTFAYGLSGTNEKVFEYAPNGVASNLCISEPSKGAGLVLRTCNGSKWQRFTANTVTKGTDTTPETDTWVNTATNDVVTANGPAKQITGAVPLDGPVPATQSWKFVG